MSRPVPARLAGIALGVALLSLLLNGVLLWQMRHPERWAAPVLRRLSADLADADGVIRREVRIPAGTPISLDIPVHERFHIALDTVIPVRTTVRVPLRSPLGTVTVPIRADVPLRTRLPLDVRHTFRLRTRTTTPLVVPIHLRIDDLLQ